MATPLTDTVSWPPTGREDEDYYYSTGEGGLMVYAVWGYLNAPSCLNDVYLDTSEVFVSAEGPLAEQITRHQREAVKSQSDWNLRVSAAVLIASTEESIYSNSPITGGNYFGVDRNSLTVSGLTIVSALEELYGEPATLVTFLDT